MKLFLSSETISYNQCPAFIELVGKKAKEIKIALIENAADIENGDKAWLEKYRDNLRALGFTVVNIDLNDSLDKRMSPSVLVDMLSKCDAIWLGGGNTYYLRWILRETKADTIIQGLARKGKVYGGGSAGAIVAGPTLKYFENADSPKNVPEIIREGLGLTDIVVVPHWNSDDYAPLMYESAEKLEKAGFQTIHITNDQALVIDGNKQTIID